MRLPTFRQRFSHHCIAYSLLMTSAASCLAMTNNAFAATVAQRYTIAAGPLDNALSQLASTANVILSFSPQQTNRLGWFHALALKLAEDGRWTLDIRLWTPSFGL